MTKFKIVNIIDKIVLSFAMFLFFFSWINFNVRNLTIAFFTSLILSGATIHIFSLAHKKKISKQEQIKICEKTKEKKLFCYKLLSKNEKFDVILEKFKNFSVKNINHPKQTFSMENKKYQTIFATQFDELNQKDLINLLDEKLESGIDKILIVCQKVNPALDTNLFASKDIILIDALTLANEYIDETKFEDMKKDVKLEKQKLNKREIFFSIFNPKKAKSYFLCGLVLIFSSLIIPYQIYYVIVGSMLMLFAIICKIVKIYY